ncbi:MAG: lipopolysaccharide kinase InaA family protein [bacterium]
MNILRLMSMGMITTRAMREGNARIVLADDGGEPEWFSAECFNPDYLATQGWLLDAEKPESDTVCFSPDGRYEFELWRGKRRFWRGLEQADGWREFQLLLDMTQRGVPVARPVAASVDRTGLRYQGAVIRYRLVEADTLRQRLERGQTAEMMWQQAGALLRQFHDLGISLPNIAADNVVINSREKLFFADFTQAFRPSGKGGQWKHRNLEHLLQSLLAARETNPRMAFDDGDWLTLTKAYIARARPQAD